MGLDRNIAALLTEDVLYSAKTGLDKHGQDVWAQPVTLKCFPTFGARQIQKPDGTVYTSVQTLHFDGTDEIVQTFQLGDKFTTVGTAGGQTLEAQEIVPAFSPGPGLADPMSQWMVEVYL